MADEPYQSLYRRFRPQRFADVRGQEHVTRALRNAVRDGRVAHAYLFSGPRGTGKTSTARILAMALNCEHPEDGEPDGTCESCVAIRRGSSLDVHELDAASNRRLEEMRELLSRVSLGTSGRWKVYIIDEVHQLTADASSALLKTLEEPPAHVVFVLATTDPQKVLQTIRSRTQHFEFHLLGAEVLGGLLHDINNAAALGVPPEAIDLVVRRGHGSARDALSVLDQVAALGEVDDEAGVVTDIVDALADQDAGRVLVAVAEAMSAGRDPRRLVNDLIEHLRNGFLAEEAPSLVMLSDDAAADAMRQARQMGRAGIVRALEVLGKAAIDLREAVDPRVTLEVALVRLATPTADGSVDGLQRRLDRLEQEVARLAGGASSAAILPAPPPAVAPRTAPEAPDPPSAPVTIRPVPGASSDAPRPVIPPARTGPPEPPPLPGRASPTGPRPSLGGVRRGAQAAPPAPSDRPLPPPAGASPPAAGASPATPVPAFPPRPSESAVGPSRDELTKLWADQVLPTLPGRIRAYLSAGRFVDGAPGEATYALPDHGLLTRATDMRGEVEEAIAAVVGGTVRLRFVAEQSVSHGRAPSPPLAAEPPPEDPEPYYDLDELEDAGPAVVSPEQRLLEAFPGAEEVTP